MALFTGLIFVLSSIPNLAPPGGLENEDKLAHVGEYLCWGLLFRRALDRTLAVPGWGRALGAVALGAGLCYLDESFQRTVGRQYSVYDMAADLTGVILAQGITTWAARSARRAARPEEVGPVVPPGESAGGGILPAAPARLR